MPSRNIYKRFLPVCSHSIMVKEGEQKELSRIILAIAIFLMLLIVSFLIVKPFVAAILGGIVLAYLLNWPYKQIDKFFKNKAVSAFSVCGLAVVTLGLVVYFAAQITIKEAFGLYMEIQKLDLGGFLNSFLPKLFPDTPQLTNQIITSLQTAVTNLTSSFVNSAGQVITNGTEILLMMFVAFFVAYYTIKESEGAINYLKDFLPFDKDINERFIKRSKEVASATIYGHFLVGLIQGICAGIGFYVFGAPSPLLFTVLAIFFAMIPYLGPWIVWFPVGLIMLGSNPLNAFLLLAFGFIFVSTIDNILRPYIIGKRAKVNQIAVLVGILGGLMLFGPIGLIVGPIILELFLIFLELYRTKEIQKFI